MPDRSFDKFTERARKVLNLARDEAHRFNHNYIGTEHILLGLVREGEGVAARVLANLGVGLPKVRQAVENIIGRGEKMVVGDIGLTPQSKKVIELAIDEARKLNHHYVGTEHLLLGLVREGEGIAAGVLESLGVSLERVRAEVINVLNASVGPLQFRSEPQSVNIDRFNEDARQVFTVSQQEARRLSHRYLGTEHILLGIVGRPESIAAQVLTQMGLDLAGVRAEVEAIIGKGEQSDTLEAGHAGTSRAGRVIALALKEAQRQSREYAGSGDLLLAILREAEKSRRPDGTIVRTTRKLFTGAVPEGEGIAAGVLIGFGVTAPKVQAALEDIYGKEVSVDWKEAVASDQFTERARKVLNLAQEEAHRFNHNYIGTEHLLLGLVRVGDTVAARVLRNLNVELHKVRSAVEFIIGRGTKMVVGEVGFTPRAKKVLELSVDEARRLGQTQVGPEHLLLGLVREGEGIAAGVLVSLGVNLNKVRAEIIKVLRAEAAGGATASPEMQGSSGDSTTNRNWVRIIADEQLNPMVDAAYEQAEAFGHFDVGSEHLLLALLVYERSLAARSLGNLGVTLEQASAQAGILRGQGNPNPRLRSGISPRFARVIDTQAKAKAMELSASKIGAEHVLLALLDEATAWLRPSYATWG